METNTEPTIGQRMRIKYCAASIKTMTVGLAGPVTRISECEDPDWRLYWVCGNAWFASELEAE